MMTEADEPLRPAILVLIVYGEQHNAVFYHVLLDHPTSQGLGSYCVRCTYLAMTNSSRTMRLPSPMYFCTSSLPETRMKVQSV